MNKMLFAIFTCNRFHYFRNCLESILEFVDLDRIRILVCDNHTTEQEMDPYLHSVSAAHKAIEVKKFKDRIRSELYRAMNWSIEYARKNNISIIHLIQDDYQYLFKNDKHLDDVENIFKDHNRIVQVNCNFGWKRKKNGIGKIKHFETEGTYYATLLQKRAVDNGFTRVAAYAKTGLYPLDAVSWGGNLKKGFDKHPGRYAGVENGEVWFGRECEKRKYKRCISLFPNIGMMYDCAYVRGDIRMGKYFKPPSKYYFKPLDKSRIDDLERRNSKKKFSFIEDFCIADCWKPQTLQKHTPDRTVAKIAI